MKCKKNAKKSEKQAKKSDKKAKKKQKKCKNNAPKVWGGRPAKIEVQKKSEIKCWLSAFLPPSLEALGLPGVSKSAVYRVEVFLARPS